jgi:hypothetical protein
MNIPRLHYLVNQTGGFLQTRDQFEETRKEVNELIAFCEYQAGLIARLIKTLSPEQAGELLDLIEKEVTNVDLDCLRLVADRRPYLAGDSGKAGANRNRG